MLKIGEYQSLTIHREMPQGFYLIDEENNEVLLPRNYITEGMLEGMNIEVFVYVDSEGRDVATTEKPFLTVGEFACLEVVDVNENGAFCDWGILKQLLIPFRNQHHTLRVGEEVIVYLLLDELTERLVGTTKISNFLSVLADEHIKKGQEVDLVVYRKSKLGYSVIVNKKYLGLVYYNELPESLSIAIGQELKGYIKPIRPDKKIDISIFPIGRRGIKTNAQKIMEQLENQNGFLPFTDKSSPEAIRETFGISKKLFKKSIGTLYKEQLIDLRPDGIYICAR